MTLKPNNLHVTNTLTRRREKFEPLSPPASADSPGEADGPHVGMYVCGPTVYGDAHLGHAKSYIAFDCIVRYLRYLGYDVTYVQNITDVGHLTDDADAGEDKVEKAARAKKVHPMQIAEQYTRRYFEDMDALNVLRPDISPRASGHIIEQIEHVKRLIERGHAYEVNGSVYFDVASWPAYGRLSGRSVQEMQVAAGDSTWRAGARVEVSARAASRVGEKRHPADFALWKRAEPGHIMQWPSPWGPGYPGWHIECTVMGQKYLGETLDIHGGGIENVFPHHEDEIAQAEAATGKPFVKYWLHNNMVTVAGKKMGKSLGNFLTLRDAFQKWPPMVIRLFILQSHYRSPTDFSEEALEKAHDGYKRLANTIRRLRSVALMLTPSTGSPPSDAVALMLTPSTGSPPSDAVALMLTPSTGSPPSDTDRTVDEAIRQAQVRVMEAMDDDFNTPQALAVLFDLARESNRLADAASASLTANPPLWQLADALQALGSEILGLAFETTVGAADTGVAPKVVEILIRMRAEARKAKDFKGADAIRDRLAEAGILLEDTPDSTTWRMK
jgi:cysteinyl-tRNA synthetase